MTGGKKRKIEFDYLIGFAVVLLVWYFLLTPFIEKLAENEGVVVGGIIALALFFTLLILLFSLLGANMSSVLKGGFTILLVYIILEIWAYPMVIPRDGLVDLDASQTISTDFVFYELIKGAGVPHTLARQLTYIGVPLACLIILLYMYDGRKLQKTLLKGVF